MPFDATVTFADGTSHVYKGVPDGTPPEAVQQQAQTEFSKPVTHLAGGAPDGPGMAALKETGRVLDQGVRGGLAATPGMIGDAGSFGVGKFMDIAKDILPEKVIPPLFRGEDPSKFGDVRHGLETAGGVLPDVSKPQTTAGRHAGNVLETIVSTMTGGGAGTKLEKAAMGAGAGGGGELSATLFGDNPVTRFLGSLAGGTATAVGASHVSNADKLIKENTAGMTDADWKKAGAVEKVLDALGMSHLKSQLLGPRSTLDDVVQTASANPQVRPKLVTAVADVPGQTGKVVDDWASRNLPSAGANNRAEILQDVQGTATSAINQMKKQSNNAFVANMPPTGTKTSSTEALYNDLVAMAKSDRFGENSDGGKALLKVAERLVANKEPTWGTPAGSNGNLIRAHGEIPTSDLALRNTFERGGKVFRISEQDSRPQQITTPEQLESAMAGMGHSLDNYVIVPPVPKGSKMTFLDSSHQVNNIAKELKLMATKEDFKGLPIKDAIALFNKYTPEFDAARQAKSTIMDSTVNPAQQGLAGQIAQMGGGLKSDKHTATDRALSIVFPPTQPQGLAIHQLAKDMGPDAVGELLREHVNKTLQQVLRGEDKSPRSFVSAIYESPAQKENVNAALEVLAAKQGRNPADVKAGFQKLMDAMDSYKDLKMAVGVSPGAVSEQAGQNVVGTVAQPLSSTRRIAGRITTAGTYEKIADLVTAKDGLAKLEKISKQPKSETLRQLMVGTFTSTSEAPSKGD